MLANIPILAADTIERRLEFADLPQGWEAVALIVLLVVLLQTAVLFYRREQRLGVSQRMRWLLAGLRCLVLVLLAVIWLEPVRATYIHRDLEAKTLILVDGSASMSLKDRYGETDGAAAKPPAAVSTEEASRLTRAEIVQRVLDHNQRDLLNRLAERNSVELFRFGEDIQPLGGIMRRSASTGEIAMGEPNEPATDVSRAVRHAIESQAGAPIAAVVVMSDGRFTRGEPPEIVGRYARSKKTPVFAIGVGDAAEPRNITVQSVEAPANVFVQDPFQITAHLRVAGLAGQNLTVDLLQSTTDSESAAVVTSQTLTVPTSGSLPPVVFRHTLGKAGQARLTVSIQPAEGESLESDNQREVTVRALDNKMRVLIVAGLPSWEFRYLARLLERDATVEVSCWLQSADETAPRDGNTIIDHLPNQPAELFEYDCIILMDPNPREFDPVWSTALETMIANNGCGLLFVAGQSYTPQFVRHADVHALVDMLPVVIEPNEADLILNELGHFQTTAWPVVVPPVASGHPVVQMGPTPGESMEVWARLPGIYWHYPVRRAKPVATVLWQHSNPRMRTTEGGHVLLATQFLGAGRTGFLACNDTWRWRAAGDAFFNRFWIQLLRHLVEGKLLSGQKRGLIQTDRETYALTDVVVVEARLLDPAFQPLRDKEITATILQDGVPSGTLKLAAQQDRPGWYRARWTPTRIGLYSLSIELAAGAGAEAAIIRRDVRVGQADVEFREPALDRQAMQALAVQSADGLYLDLADATRLVDLIPSKTISLVLDGQPTRLWDRGWSMAALVTLLGFEWLLRKRVGLL